MSNDSDIQHIRDLVRRKQDLEDRDSLLELEEIKLRKSVAMIDAAEAALLEQKELAATADRIVDRHTFRSRFCDLYAGYQQLVDRVEKLADLADKVCELINQLYPSWLGHLTVATLCAAIILKRGVDIYCST